MALYISKVHFPLNDEKLKQGGGNRIAYPAALPVIPLHILRPAGLLLPLFLPQDTVNALSDLLGFPGSDRRARCGCRASP